MNTLTVPDRSGLPTLKSVCLKDREFVPCPKVFCTVVVSKKTPSKYKARLCARGDMLKNFIREYVSAPTVTRSTPRILIALAGTLRFELDTDDISSAFTQSSPMAPNQRVILILPWYLNCPWDQRIQMKRGETPTQCGMLTAKPIYGETCAPLRRLAKISEVFRWSGWHQCSVDPCVYRFEKEGVLLGMAAIHVDDVLFGFHPDNWDIAERAIQTFTHSGLAKLDINVAVVYLGLDIIRRVDCVEISQPSFRIDYLPLMFLTCRMLMVPHCPLADCFL